MTDLPAAAITAGPAAALLRAISDPGSILPRLRSHDGGLEPLPEWQTRAVLEAAAPHLTAAAQAELRDIVNPLRLRVIAEHLEWDPPTAEVAAHAYHLRFLADLLEAKPQPVGADAEPGDLYGPEEN